jgi:hypothetical protein
MSTALQVHREPWASPEDILLNIEEHGPFMGENDTESSEWAVSKGLKNRVHLWHRWFVENYATEESPNRLADLYQ